MSRSEVLRTSLPEYRCLRAELDAVDGFHDICTTLMEIVKNLFGGKKKQSRAATREEAMVERFGGIQMPTP